MHADGCTWIVVADGGHARILEERRRGATLTEANKFEHSQSDVAVPRDRPARVHERNGDVRHAVTGRTSPHEEGERRFLSSVAAQLEDGAARHAFDHLILLAPPRALGVLRAALSDKLTRLVVAEAPLDFAHEAIPEIMVCVRHLRQARM